MKIKKLDPDDEELFQKVKEYVFQRDEDGHLKYSFGGLLEPRRWLQDEQKVLEDLDKEGKLSVFLALDEDNEVIGSYWSKETERKKGKEHQGQLHVRPDHWREGIATELVKTRDKENSDGMKVLTHTATSQGAIRRIAEKLGYTLHVANRHIDPETANEEQLLHNVERALKTGEELNDKTVEVIKEKGLEEDLEQEL